MPPTVAIIMRAKNEMPHVQRTLEMLQRQTILNYDLFAVDSGSSDGTLETLEESCPKERLAQISPDNYVPGKVLNEAIARTDHPIIILLNADAIPLSNDWLEHLVAPILEKQADAAFSRQVARNNAPFIVSYDYRRAYDPKQTAPGFFSAVACAFRREVWEANKFRERGYAEDTIWARECIAAGFRIQLVPDSRVEHSHNYTLKELCAKKRRQAQALAETGSFESNLITQLYVCCREVIRDLGYALVRLRPITIPYNLAYRIAAHTGIYRGLSEGRK